MPYVLAFHVIAMVAWFAGLFYLPRLFIYHTQATDSISLERFKIMERRLFRGIMTPAMLITIILGIWLLMENPGYYFKAGWMHAKLTFVILLIIYHHLCLIYMKKFARGENKHGTFFYRVFNEIPTVLLIAIVILVVVKPF